ncbi:hypothetical protein AKO1_008878, partial [Acrasis kona]
SSLTKNISVSEVELRNLLNQFKVVSDDEGLLDRANFDMVVRNSITKRFDSSIVPAFHRIYEAFDMDGNGRIDFFELATGMSTLLYGDKKEVLQLLFSLFDVNKDGSVEQEEMLDFFKKYYLGQSKMNGYKLTSSRWKSLEEHLKRLFAATDLDSSGTIDYDEFLKAVRDVDHPLGMLLLSMEQEHQM